MSSDIRKRLALEKAADKLLKSYDALDKWNTLKSKDPKYISQYVPKAKPKRDTPNDDSNTTT
jgi:hypothetical protein